jgi:hypothetical protein
MTQRSCACGYQADSTEDLTDHLGEMFIPPDDIAPDGQAHAEAARAEAATGHLTCHCGYTADIAEFDQHLIGAFTPANQIGHDGIRHAPA